MRRKPVDIDRGWAWVILVAVYIGIIILSTTIFMNGFLLVALLAHFDADEAKTSLVGALNGGLLTLFGPLASLVMTKYTCRLSIFLGGVLTIISCLTSAFAGNVDSIILTYGVIGGIGNCLASTPYVVVLGYYFQKRRNIVIAISQAVVGCGFFLASPLAFILLYNFGLRGTFLILGGINAQLCVVAMICKPSSIEQHILDTKSEDSVTSGQNEGDRIANKTAFIKKCQDSKNISTDKPLLKYKSSRCSSEPNEQTSTIQLPLMSVTTFNEYQYTQPHFEKTICTELNDWFEDTKFISEAELKIPKQTSTACAVSSENENKNTFYKTSKMKNIIRRFRIIKNLRFLMILLSGMSWNFTLSMCMIHLPNYMAVRGADEFEISAIMTCFSACNLAGRFLAAMTVDKGGIDSLTLDTGMLGVAAIVTLAFPLYSGSIGDFLFAGAIGLYVGGLTSLMTPISLKMVCVEDLSAARGLECFFSGLGCVPGPFMAGLLYTLFGTYDQSFVCGGCVLLLGCLFAMASATSSEVPGNIQVPLDKVFTISINKTLFYCYSIIAL